MRKSVLRICLLIIYSILFTILFNGGLAFADKLSTSNLVPAQADPSQPQVKTQPSEEELIQKDIQNIIAQQNITTVGTNPKQEGSSKYTLGENDVIEVDVMRHPEVSGQYMINSEG